MWLGNAVTSSTLHADPPSNETIDVRVFYIKILSLVMVEFDWQSMSPVRGTDLPVLSITELGGKVYRNS